jgi:hypothetical protein
MKKLKSNEGYSLAEILVSLLIITIITVSVVAINGHALNLYKYGIVQSKEINRLASSSEGVYTDSLKTYVDKDTDFTIDYILKADSSNMTYSTYLDPDDNYTYRGTGMYMRYVMESFETKDEYAGLAPYFLERYRPYD